LRKDQCTQRVGLLLCCPVLAHPVDAGQIIRMKYCYLNQFAMKPNRVLIQILAMAVCASSFAATNELQIAIESFPEVAARKYRPDVAVDSANVLIAAGKTAACAALKEVIRDKSKPKDGVRDFDFNERACLICRVLFTPPRGEPPLRPPMIGAPRGLPHNSITPTNWADMPFVIVNEVPLSMLLGYALAGVSEQAQSYLAYCETNGIFRTQPFPRPTQITASNALNQVFDSAAWKALKWEDSGEGWRYNIDEADTKERLWEQIRNMKAEPSK
jgi:hypothetical protein